MQLLVRVLALLVRLVVLVVRVTSRCVVTPGHVASRRVMSFPVASGHVASRHMMSCPVTSSALVSSVMSRRVVSRHIMSRPVTSSVPVSSSAPSTSSSAGSMCYKSRYVALRNVMSRRAMSRHVVSRRVTSRHVTSRDVLSGQVGRVIRSCVTHHACRVASCHVLLRRVISRHVTRCVISSHAMEMAGKFTTSGRCVVKTRHKNAAKAGKKTLWQGGDVKAQPAKTRRNKNRGRLMRVAKRGAGAQGRARQLCVPLSYIRFYSRNFRRRLAWVLPGIKFIACVVCDREAVETPCHTWLLISSGTHPRHPNPGSGLDLIATCDRSPQIFEDDL